ncbi:MAG: hypothetical protein A3F70_11305 [Acidobacteria bacterium RIFCSPLOWO2_12_FULL_67_14]|nr:MAG: hypothetical protein A3F70_11305 [Acidobacteria bacterium RIFCSPLOWO2_12_FULL_67_14]
MRVLAALLGVAAGFALLLHAPPVRRTVLRRVLPVIEEQYGLIVAAGRLDYNLATLRLGVAGLSVAAVDSPYDPFLTADYVAVTLPWRALLGEIAFDDVTADRMHIVARKRSDGTTNLPRTTEERVGEPPPLRIARLAVPQLAVELRDEQAIRHLWMPSVDLLLTRNEGHIALRQPAELNTETQFTAIFRLEGGASFDGRTLGLEAVNIEAPEGGLKLDGSVTIVAQEPSVNIRARGRTDLTRLTRWVVANGELPRGDVDFDATVSGALDSLGAQMRLSSDAIGWQGASMTDVAADVGISTAAVEVSDLRLAFAGGRVTAGGVLPLDDDGAGQGRASWTGVDAAAAVLMMAPDAAMAPAAATSGELNARGFGSDVESWSATLRATLRPGRNARGRLALSGDGTLELTNGRWRYVGRHVAGGVAPIQVRLEGVLRDDAIAGTVRVADTGLPQLLAVLRTTGLADIPPNLLRSGTGRVDLQVAGTLDAPRIDAQARLQDVSGPEIEASDVQATVSGQPVQSQLQFTAAAPQISVSGEAIADVRTAGRLAGTILTVEELTARQPSAPGRLVAAGTYDTRAGRYTASLEGTDWRLMPTAEGPAAGIVSLRFAGSGTIDDPQGTGEITVREGRWQDLPVGSVLASVTLDRRSARIEAEAPRFVAAADARVQLEAPYGAVIDARAAGLDLSLLRDYMDTGTMLTGTATVRLHAETPLERWRSGSAAVVVESFDGVTGELRLSLVEPARARYEAEQVQLDSLEMTAGDVRLSASGTLPAFEPAPGGPGLAVTVTGDVDAVARAVAATGLKRLAVTGGTGPLAVRARVTGALRAPVVAGDLDVGPGSIALEGLPPVSGLRVRAHAEEGWVELREARLSYEGAEVSAVGKAPLSFLAGAASGAGVAVRGAGPAGGAIASTGGPAVLRVTATNLTPAVLAPFVEPGTLDEVTGSLDATLDAAAVTADVAALTGELRIDRFDLRIAGLPVTQRIPTRIVARDGFARVEAWEWVGQGATLGVRGQVRLSDRQTAILANGVLDLRMLTPFVRAAGMTTAGRLEPRLSITGELTSPRIDGDLTITDGEIRLVDPRVVVSDLSVRTVLTRTTARVTAMAGSINGGSMRGEGAVEYTAGSGVDASLTADVRGMALEFPQGLRSELDAELTLTAGPPVDANESPAGPAPRPPLRSAYAGRVSGTVTVLRGTYREPMAVVTGLLAGLRTQRLAASADAPDALDALALDIRVITDEDVIVDNNYGRFQLGANLRLIGTAAAPALSGRAEVREGGQLFVGRNVYAVTFGAVDFANPVAIEPNLNVAATTRAGGEDIEVTITGPAESPSVTMRSSTSPDLGQAEIASLLLTGRPLDELAPGDATFVGTQVLGNFSAEVLGFASRAVGLDTLRLGGVEGQTVRRDPGEVAIELDPATRMTFGKSLGSEVDITFSQSLRESDAQTWIVEYLPVRGLELRLVSDDDDFRSYGFRHDLSLGGAPRSAARPSSAARESLRVASVTIAGDPALPETRIRDLLRLQPGDRFNFGAWQDDRDRLEALYRREHHLAARVSARRSDGADGVALTYEIAAGPLTIVTLIGIDAGSALMGRLESAWVEAVFDDFLVDEAVQIVRSDLARSGYLRPAIDARIRSEEARTTLEIGVQAGERSTETRVRIEGIADALAAEVGGHLASLGVSERAVVDPGAAEREATAYLHARGYLQARATAGAPLFDGGTAVVPLTVSAGEVFTIARVAFEGAESLPADVLRDAMALTEGEPYAPAALEAARERLVALHRREGFAAATVAARPAVRPDRPAVDIVFAVDEGARQVLAEVVISGNRAIDPDVITRALDFPAGSPMRAEDVLRARSRVFDTRLFRRLDVTSEPLSSGADSAKREAEQPRADPPTFPMRLRIVVEEWPAARLRYGFVVAEERPENDIEGRGLVPGFSADITRRTLFGRALTIGSSAALQRREQRGRLFVSAPTFLGLPVESSLIGERSRETFEAATLVTSRSGVTWEQRTRVGDRLSLSYAYTFERNHTFDTKSTESDPLAFDITVNIARLNGAAAWDTRDDPIDAARGLFASSTIEFAPEAVGSDIRFVRQVQQAYYFRPWRRIVLASAARLGTVVPIGGQELIPSERFFAGGSRTVRGVQEGGLGPRDFFGAAGGRLMVVLNQEVRVPLYRWLRGIAFVDAGNVFARPRDASLRDLVGSLGLGLRLTTPFALLRIDYGRTAWGAAEPSGRWTFGIGQAF